MRKRAKTLKFYVDFFKKMGHCVWTQFSEKRGHWVLDLCQKSGSIDKQMMIGRHMGVPPPPNVLFRRELQNKQEIQILRAPSIRHQGVCL